MSFCAVTVILMYLLPGGRDQEEAEVAQTCRTEKFCSVQFTRSVVSDSLRPHGLQHAHHQLPELAQTYVHRVGDAMQPSHPLSSPSPPAFNLSQHQGVFQWVSSSPQVAKALGLQLPEILLQKVKISDGRQLLWRAEATRGQCLSSLLRSECAKSRGSRRKKGNVATSPGLLSTLGIRSHCRSRRHPAPCSPTTAPSLSPFPEMFGKQSLFLGHFSRLCGHPQFWDLDSGGEGPRSPSSSSHLATTSTCARSPRRARPSGRCCSRPRPDLRRPGDRGPSALPHLLSRAPRVWLG